MTAAPVIYEYGKATLMSLEKAGKIVLSWDQVASPFLCKGSA